MFRDELKQPLRKKSLSQRLWAKRPSLLATAYVLTAGVFLAGGGWAIRQPMPFAGEPVVSLTIPAAEEIKTASTDPAPAAGNEEVADAAVPDIDPNDPAAQAQPPPSEDASEQQFVKSDDTIIVQPRRSLAPAPIDAVTEVSTWGQLPRISKTGDKPSKVYARTASLNDIHSDQPKIAILLGGLGLNKKLTQRAIRELPGEVTLAFAPYGADLQEQVNAARAGGHEIFLQIPLEPIGYPASNPGPKTLLGDASDAENIDSMRWLMSRFAGYAGVVNYMGGRFLSMPKALKPMFAELKSRGLLFLEDGSLALSATEGAAKAANLQVQRAKTVIDADPSPQAISNALNMLEEEAKANGIAVGTGSGLEITIDTLKDWAKEANDRGIILVPVTASFQGRLG
ncbi:divergent polysaccharide deacetylase family protein [Aestuariivirga sp.]|uniref:divergent polysaccharide deacetylase family protein n=1 Tax=Aestuariivirga sp. TaxID=2650926 RepID=UPI0039E6BFD1